MAGVINELIREIVVEMGVTAITITHDMASARAIGDKVADVADADKAKEIDVTAGATTASIDTVGNDDAINVQLGDAADVAAVRAMLPTFADAIGRKVQGILQANWR